MHADRPLPGQVCEQPALAVVELATGRQLDPQSGHRLAAESHWYGEGFATTGVARCPVTGGRLVIDRARQLDRGVGQAKRLGHGVDQAGQKLIGRQRRLHPLAQPGQGAVGVGAIAVHPLLGPAANSRPQRFHDDRRRDDGGQATYAAVVDQRAEAVDARRVDQGEPGGQRPVDE